MYSVVAMTLFLVFYNLTLLYQMQMAGFDEFAFRDVFCFPL
jgi:hypothetical protein